MPKFEKKKLNGQIAHLTLGLSTRFVQVGQSYLFIFVFSPFVFPSSSASFRRDFILVEFL